MPNYILKELNEEMTNGRKVIFPKMQVYSLHDYETVLRHMHTYAGSFSEGTMRGVIEALVGTMEIWMPLGHSMKIDGLGTFSLSLGFDDQEDNEDAKPKYRHICVKGVNFKPDARLVEMLNRNARFEKAAPEVVVPKKCKYTMEERMAKALEVIDRNGYMTLAEYAGATGLCRSAACNDLKGLVALPGSPITTRGSGSHKVWVRQESFYHQ